ncbi:hypothetical protein NHJ13051_005451 [Beauveria bassiana]
MSQQIFRHARFGLDALLALAGDLRGRKCTCDTTAAPKTGSMNWVIFVSFDDGVQWAFRSPRTGFEAIISDDSAKKMLLSEVATLKVLRQQTTVPVPEVYSFRFGGTHLRFHNAALTVLLPCIILSAHRAITI